MNKEKNFIKKKMKQQYRNDGKEKKIKFLTFK